MRIRYLRKFLRLLHEQASERLLSGRPKPPPLRNGWHLLGWRLHLCSDFDRAVCKRVRGWQMPSVRRELRRQNVRARRVRTVVRSVRGAATAGVHAGWKAPHVYDASAVLGRHLFSVVRRLNVSGRLRRRRVHDVRATHLCADRRGVRHMA